MNIFTQNNVYNDGTSGSDNFVSKNIAIGSSSLRNQELRKLPEGNLNNPEVFNDAINQRDKDNDKVSNVLTESQETEDISKELSIIRKTDMKSILTNIAKAGLATLLKSLHFTGAFTRLVLSSDLISEGNNAIVRAIQTEVWHHRKY